MLVQYGNRPRCTAEAMGLAVDDHHGIVHIGEHEYQDSHHALSAFLAAR
jgi:hypothetical protein